MSEPQAAPAKPTPSSEEAKPTSAEAKPKAEEPKPAPKAAAPPAEEAKPEPKAAEASKPVETAKPAEAPKATPKPAAKPSEAAKAPETTKPTEAPKPAPKAAEAPAPKTTEAPAEPKPVADAHPAKPAEVAKPQPAAEAPAQPKPAEPSQAAPTSAVKPAPKQSQVQMDPAETVSSISTTPSRSTVDRLKQLFKRFCNFGAGQRGAGDHMDNAKFVKFCKDTKLIDGGRKFTATSADLLFSKIRPKGGRTINFECFKYSGLPDIAAKKGTTVQQVIDGMLAAEGPKSSGTVGDAVRFHDDKSQYTGVYKAGGPTNVDLGTSDLSHITNRQSADVRGSNIVVDKKIPQREVPKHGGDKGRVSPQKMRTSPTKARPTQQQMQKASLHVGEDQQMAVVPEGQASGSAENSPKSNARYGRRADPTCPPSPTRRTNSGGRAPAGTAAKAPAATGFKGVGASPKNSAPPATISSAQSTRLMELFESYLMFGGGQNAKSEMDGVRFTKFCKDGSLFDRAFSAIDSDLMFSRIKPKGGRTITFEVWCFYLFIIHQ